MLADTTPTLPIHDEIDALIDRLARLNALRMQISAIAGDLHADDQSSALAEALSTLERDLTLTARTAGRIQARLDGPRTQER